MVRKSQEYYGSFWSGPITTIQQASMIARRVAFGVGVAAVLALVCALVAGRLALGLVVLSVLLFLASYGLLKLHSRVAAGFVFVVSALWTPFVLAGALAFPAGRSVGLFWFLLFVGFSFAGWRAFGATRFLRNSKRPVVEQFQTL